MSSSVIFNPTRAFEEAFSDPAEHNPLGIVIVSSFLFALIGYAITATPIGALHFFVAGVIQWIILTVLVWFFELAHLKKRKGLVSTTFSECAAVTGKLWRITLSINFLALLVIVIYPLVRYELFNIIGLIGFVLAVALVIANLVASYKMFKVVTKLEGRKLLVNWILLILINALTSFLIVGLVGRLF